MNRLASPVEGIAVLGKTPSEFTPILTPQALGFVATLARKFENRRRELMQARVARQA
jgi:malate synthase